MSIGRKIRFNSVLFVTVALVAAVHSAKADDGERIIMESTVDTDQLNFSSLPQAGCPAADEFKQVMTELRKNSEFKDNEGRMRDIAFKISHGCEGSSRRFLDAFAFLKQKELGGDQSMNLAIELALKDDQYLNVFKEVIVRALDPKQLAMDLRGSVLLAQELSIHFTGEPKRALAEFGYLVEFCSDPKEMALSKPRCIDVSLQVAKLTASEDWENEEVTEIKNRISPAKAFTESYKFMRSIGSHVGEALMISYDVVKISPYAVKNFITGYEYGSAKTGLDLPARGAIQFAMEMANRTLPGGGEEDISRLPASEKSSQLMRKKNNKKSQ